MKLETGVFCGSLYLPRFVKDRRVSGTRIPDAFIFMLPIITSWELEAVIEVVVIFITPYQRVN